MKTLFALPLAFFVGLLAVGCSSSSSGSSSFSCDETEGTSHVCSTYSNLSSEQETAASDACTSGSGKSVSSCSTTDALGTCALTEGTLDYSETYYSTGGLTASEAQSGCTSGGGKWTAAK